MAWTFGDGQRTGCHSGKDRLRSIEGDQISCYALAVAPRFHIVSNLLACNQTRHASLVYRRNVHEGIRSASVRLDDAKATDCVEKFHCTSRHENFPLPGLFAPAF